MTADFFQKMTLLRQGVCVCNTWTDVKLLLWTLFIMFINARELLLWTCLSMHGGHSISLGLCPTKLPGKWDIQLGQLDVPAIRLFQFSWHGKGLTPTTEILVLHGCRNLRFSSVSFSILFARYFYGHGKGLSREPYSDYFLFRGLCLWLGWRFRKTSICSQFSSKRSTL